MSVKMRQEVERKIAEALRVLRPGGRLAVSDVVVRGGFPPVILSPVNFEAIYQAQRDPQPVVEPPAVQIITPTISH